MDILKKLRDRIDWLDSQIAFLLNERMQASDEVGKFKRKNQQVVEDPAREKCILHQVETLVQHPILKADISYIYKKIIQESRIAQQLFQCLSQPFRRIGIIGVGLMGGSILKALKTKDASIEVRTLAHPCKEDSLACEEEWISQTSESISDLIQNSDLIILASPISTIIPLAEEIKQHADPIKKLIVMDIASVKGGIVEAFEKLSNEHIEFIGTHPMAGKEKSGFANSQATLFVSRPWVITPHQNNLFYEIEKIKELIRYLGAEPICLEANVHDQQAALVSHLPTILSKSYFDFVNAVDPASLSISGPGFQAFTRLAHDNQEMRTEICSHNKKAIQDFLDQWLAYIIKNREC